MRIILHLDMDAFFAAVEERDKPRLKGMPIVVGADPAGGKGRGVVSTANYAARKYGIRSALPISIAWRYSQKAKSEGKPEVVFMEPDIPRYAKESDAIFEYLRTKSDPAVQARLAASRVKPGPSLTSRAGAVEQSSIDEGYVDVSFCGSYAKAEKFAKEIKEYIRKEHRLTCTIGVGPNKLVAKIAAQEKKPDGLTVVPEEKVQEFLDPKEATVIPGIGPKTEEQLLSLGVTTILELRKKSKAFLVEHFGKKGEDMFLAAQGIDERPIETEREAKSIGEQMTFQKDTLDMATILQAFRQMATNVATSLKRQGLKSKTVAIVVRFSDFETLTRSHSMVKATDSKKVLETEALNLLMPFLNKEGNPRKKLIRLVGIRAENLEKA